MNLNTLYFSFKILTKLNVLENIVISKLLELNSLSTIEKFKNHKTIEQNVKNKILLISKSKDIFSFLFETFFNLLPLEIYKNLESKKLYIYI